MTKKTILCFGAAALALALGGCHKTTTGQVVAIVNDDEITQQQLNAELQGAKIPDKADKQKVLAQITEGLVNRQLEVQQAKAAGLDKQPEYLAQLLKLQNELLIKMLVNKIAKDIPLPDAAAVNKFIADNPLMFSQRKLYQLDQIAFATPQDHSILDALKPAHSLDQITSILTAHAIAFNRGKGELDTALVPPNIANGVAGLPSGEPFLIPKNGQTIVSVVASVAPNPTPDDKARSIAARLLRDKTINDAVKAQLDKAKSAAKIQYSPGYAPQPAK